MKSLLSVSGLVLTGMLALLPLAAPAYQIGEDTPPQVPASPAGGQTAAAGPIRLARFSFVQGNVTWRASDGAAWSPASVNLPIRQGAQVWVTNGGRAEVQFDDGSLLRLGNGAVATLQTLYSDENGEFTELNLSEGLAALKLRGTESIYQIDTPFVSVKSEGPSKVRVGVDNSVEIAVRLGKATVEGSGTKTTLSNGDYLDLADSSSAYTINPLPDEDSWDRFNDDRDQELADADTEHRLPSDIALVAGNLDSYGSWHDDPKYGQVWCPRETEAGWRPYQHGDWVWVEPFGWTWVSDEAWGWAPYHYGTWVSEPYGWGWVPGPARQYWCPAVVHFSEYNGGVAWAPLCPTEVHYPPSLAIGFRGGNWSTFFSIGGAAVYYPYNNDYCEARPFNNVTVNHVTYVNNVTNIRTFVNQSYGTIVNRNIYTRNFVPVNARSAAGVTTASTAEFGGAGRYHPQGPGGAAFFTRGHGIGAPRAGFAPVAGPISVRPTAVAATSSRSFLPGASPNTFVSQRGVFRAPLPDRVARFAPPLRSSAPVLRSFSPLRRSGFGVIPSRSEPGQTPVQSRRDFGDQARQNALEARQSLGQTGPSRQRPVSSGDNFPRANPGRIPILLPRENNPPRDNNSPRGPVELGVPREYRYRLQPGADGRPASSRPEGRPDNRSESRPESRPVETKPAEDKPAENKPAEDNRPDSIRNEDRGGRGGRARE